MPKREAKVSIKTGSEVLNEEISFNEKIVTAARDEREDWAKSSLRILTCK